MAETALRGNAPRIGKAPAYRDRGKPSVEWDPFDPILLVRRRLLVRRPHGRSPTLAPGYPGFLSSHETPSTQSHFPGFITRTQLFRCENKRPPRILVEKRWSNSLSSMVISVIKRQKLRGPRQIRPETLKARGLARYFQSPRGISNGSGLNLNFACILQSYVSTHGLLTNGVLQNLAELMDCAVFKDVLISIFHPRGGISPSTTDDAHILGFWCASAPEVCLPSFPTDSSAPDTAWFLLHSGPRYSRRMDTRACKAITNKVQSAAILCVHWSGPSKQSNTPTLRTSSSTLR